MPFGGCKASGYGRFGGRAGIAEFTELRWITIQTQPASFPSEPAPLNSAGDDSRQPLRIFHAIECPAWGTMPTGIPCA